MENTITKSSTFYRDMFRLALPIVFQNLITTAVGSADVIMLGWVSQTALSAGSLASQIMFILNLVYSGISSGIGMLAAQYWGRKDTRTIEKIMGIGMKLSILVSFLFFVLACFFPRLLMLIFTSETELIDTGISYLRIVGISYLFMSISQVYLCTMRSIERVVFATVTNGSALGLNIILNAVFIFGLLGLPKMGILGVALATTIARGVELLICMADACRFETIRFRPSILLEHHKVLFQDFMKYSLPAFGNEVSWGVGFSMYSVIMGHLGSDMVAANAVAVVAKNLGTVVCFGIANAGAILLGKAIGAGQMDTVKEDASRFCWITFVSGIAGGALIILLRPLFMNMADLSSTAQGYLSIMLFINMYSVLGQAMNSTVICGVFRAGGDSRWGFICDVIDMWLFAVPLGFISAFVLKLPPMWVYFLIYLDEFVKLPFVYRHYKSVTGQTLTKIKNEYTKQLLSDTGKLLGIIHFLSAGLRSLFFLLGVDTLKYCFHFFVKIPSLCTHCLQDSHCVTVFFATVVRISTEGSGNRLMALRLPAPSFRFVVCKIYVRVAQEKKDVLFVIP